MDTIELKTWLGEEIEVFSKINSNIIVNNEGLSIRVEEKLFNPHIIIKFLALINAKKI